MTAGESAPQCAAPAVPDGSGPGPMDWPAGAHSRNIGDILGRLHPEWAKAMDDCWSPWEQYVRDSISPRHGSAAGREHAGIWPRPESRGRHAAPVTEPVPVMTRPYRIPEEDGPGPASQEQAAEASAQGLARAGRDADFSPPPTPGPPGDDEARRERDAQAAQHAAEEALKRAGVTDRDFAELHRPHETAEMTAITERPEQEQQQ